MYVAHLDIRSFYAACEQYLNPELRGKPLIIYNESAAGVKKIIAVSKEAKRLGIGRDTSIDRAGRIARKKKRNLIQIKSRLDEYRRVSDEIYQKCKGYVEKQGFLISKPHVDDIVISSDKDLASLMELIEKVKKGYKKRDFELAVGISFNPQYAHIAAKLSKEYGFIYFGRGIARRFIYTLPAISFPGIGEKKAEILEGMGIETVGGVANSSLETITMTLGKVSGTKIYYSILEAEPERLQELQSDLFRNI